MKTVGRPRSILRMLAPLMFVFVSCGSKSDAPTATGVDETSETDTSPRPTDSLDSSQPDCTGGPPILETEVLAQSLVVRESIDGRWFCIEYGSNGADFNSVPEATGNSEVQLTNSGQWGAVTSYVFTVPADFPETLSVRNESGEELPVARGHAGDYLVVFDPYVGQPTAEITFVDRTLDLIATDGSVITQVNFEGFGTSEFASYEQFLACVNDAGVDMALPPTPGVTLPPRDPTPRETLEVAWRTCEDLLYSYLEGNGQGGAEFLDNARFVADCLADAGYFNALNEPRADLAAYQLAIDACEGASPGQAALTSCLSDNGLNVATDGQSMAGPYDPPASDLAWQACRDTFVIWFVSSPMLVPDIMPRLDCAAAEGWIIALADGADYADTSFQAVESACRA